MAELTPYTLSMTGEEADSGIQTGMKAGATAGVLYGDGRGGIRAASPGTDFGFPSLKGNGPPTAGTAANLGQFYFNMMATDIPYLYVCVGYSGSGFAWATVGSEVIAGDGGNLDDGGSPVPPHGEAGQALIKLSGASGDYGWGSVGDIAPGAVGNAQLQPNAVGADNIQNRAVGNAQLQPNAVGADNIQAEAVSKTYTFSLPAEGWLEESGGVFIDVAVSGITAADEPIPGVNWAAMPSGGSVAELAQAAALVYRFEAMADSIRVHAYEVPEVSVPAKIKVVRK